MMDDDPLEFEVDREAVRRYLASFWMYTLGLPGLILAGGISNILSPALFGPQSFVANWVLTASLGAACFYVATLLAHRMAESDAATLRYWIDEGDNLRVDSGFFDRRRTSIPLDRLGDIVLHQGIITRGFGIWTLKIHIAGGRGRSSSVSLLGLKAPEKVRDLLLDERRKAIREIQTERYA